MNSYVIMIAIVAVVAIIGIIVIVAITSLINSNPFIYPILKYRIDISGRKNPNYNDCIDQWIIDNRDCDFSDMCEEFIRKWETECENKLNGMTIGHDRNVELYHNMKETVNSENYQIIWFEFTRNQTRYQQNYYQKNSYNVVNVVYTQKMTLKELLKNNKELKRINYETTREKYNSKSQRKLMTKDLRERIMIRDNYTCQKCGKVMRDGVGLQIDHILAIKNGGKSVESNLQVLCDKCNRKKGAKIEGKVPFDVTRKYMR